MIRLLLPARFARWMKRNVWGARRVSQFALTARLNRVKTALGKKAVVNPILCKGDGLCNAKCPTGAIQLKHFTDKELFAQIDAMVP